MKNYRFIHPDPTLKNNLMAFGLECGPGWYPLIEELFDKLDELYDNNVFEIVQVKEKFGTLRVYIFGGSDKVDNLIDEYERKSSKICEKCGRPGKLIENHGWLMTLCNECYKDIS